MNDRLDEAADRAFARHETFHPRYGWFRKSVWAAAGTTTDRDLFLAEDATVELGVGKNMVRAIRFWGRAAKLLTEIGNPGRPRMGLTVPTLNGIAMFDDDWGLDPSMELAATAWVLHWWMLKPVTELPVWWLTFHRFGAVEFTEDELVQFAQDEIARAGWELPHVSSIRKDVSCLIRMYSASGAAGTSLDDYLDCPMRELELLEPSSATRHGYRFRLGPKASLPDLVLAYACLDWMAAQDVTAATTSISRLASATGSPGRAFRMDEAAVEAALERATVLLPAISLASAAGIRLLVCDGEPSATATEALLAYYRRFRSLEIAQSHVVFGTAAAFEPASKLPAIDSAHGHAHLPIKPKRVTRATAQEVVG